MSWQDLPSDLAETILDRLPISDHVRFRAVCRAWLSMQRDQYHGHVPSLPRLLHLPLLIPPQQEQREATMVCYSPFEQRFYRFHLSSPIAGLRCLCSSHGWLLLVDSHPHYTAVTLVNPVSDVQTKLADLYIHRYLFSGCVSSPPDDPSCCVVVASTSAAYLWRATHPRRWIYLKDLQDWWITSIVFCKGHFYCKPSGGGVLALDPCPPPSAARPGPSTIVYRMRQYPGSDDEISWDTLVESDGNVLLVDAVASAGTIIIRVFEHDFHSEIWSRVESLSGRVLFLTENCSVSKEAADGQEEDCVYFPGSFFGRFWKRNWSPWMKFELKTGQMIHGGVPESMIPECVGSNFLKNKLLWICPAVSSIATKRGVKNDASIAMMRDVKEDASIAMMRDVKEDASIAMTREVKEDTSIAMTRDVKYDASIAMTRDVKYDASIAMTRAVKDDAVRSEGYLTKLYWRCVPFLVVFIVIPKLAKNAKG